jgi:GTP 3',8-cyclase
MRDAFGRAITYLRLSVTDRCNLGCSYCVDPEEGKTLPFTSLLAIDEIAEIARSAVDLGIRKIRLTGGEPLLRHDVVDIVRLLAATPGVEDLAMTTNGSMLAPLAHDLARSGLRRVNVSLDTLDPERYRVITHGGVLAEVLAGIEAARQAGLAPIKLNCVMARTPLEPDARSVADFAQRQGYEARFIPRMDLRRGIFGVVQPGGGGDCVRCNRVRVTSAGMVRPCLFSDLAFSVRTLGARAALSAAIGAKPQGGTTCARHAMQRIGG